MTAATICSIPTRGFRLSGRVSPEISSHGGHFTYARAQFDASAYRPVSDRVVVAGRVRLGTIFGASAVRHRAVAALLFGRRRLGARLWLPAARAQGRGRRPDRRPRPRRIRARSPHSAQAIRRQFRDRAVLRWRIADRPRRCPDFKNWRFAAGVGVRYYSSFGPIRVDVGVPLNRQKGDGPFAVTVSLGQAF